MKKRIAHIICILLWLVTIILICYTSSSNGESSSEQSGFFSSILINIIQWCQNRVLSTQEVGSIHFEIRKFIGHFSLFLVNGLLSYFVLSFYLHKNYRYYILLAFGLGLAILSECLQIVAGGRSPAIHDILLDFFGYIIPVILIYSLSLTRKSNELNN